MKANDSIAETKATTGKIYIDSTKLNDEFYSNE